MKTQLSSALAMMTLSSWASATTIDVYKNPLDYVGGTKEMSVGQPAPPLEVEQWLNGSLANGVFQPGVTYVVEFWATWCGPCRKSIPHLVDLQARHGDQKIQVLGIAATEEDGVENLQRFVADHDPAINYPIAFVDEPKVYRDWMEAGRTFGLPWVFIIDRTGRIAWWGQPFYEQFEATVEAITLGTFDLRGEELARLANRDTTARAWTVSRRLDAALEREDWTVALDLIDELAAIDEQRYWWERVEKLNILLAQVEDSELAVSYALELMDSSLRLNPHGMTALSDIVVSHSGNDHPQAAAMLEIAERAVGIANDLTFESNPNVFALAARVACQSSRPETAAEWTVRALQAADSATAATLLKEISTTCSHS